MTNKRFQALCSNRKFARPGSSKPNRLGSPKIMDSALSGCTFQPSLCEASKKITEHRRFNNVEKSHERLITAGVHLKDRKEFLKKKFDEEELS